MTQRTTTSDEISDVRPDIAASWRRASLAGVEHSGAFERLVPRDIDRNGSLLVGAGPVLDQLEASLAGTGFSTILGDRECRIVRRWDDDPRTREGLDLLNIREGASMLEETIGTNGIGTVFETRHPVVIHGSEHFAESLRHFSCYGHPIRHPLTRRIEGVLDISALVDTASPLLPPLIARAVHDIEQRLLDGSRISEKSLLAAFQEASGRSKHAVLAIGEDIVMSNQAAASLLSSSDIALLRVLGDDPPESADSTLRFTLETGRPADVMVTRVPGARRGVLLRVVERACGPHLTPPSMSPVRVPDRAPAPTLVCGPPGTGRSTRAKELGSLPTKVFHAATALLEGQEVWAKEFDGAMRRPGGCVVVEAIDLLSDELLDLVIDRVDLRSRPQLVFTSGPVETLTGWAATLAGTAVVRDELTTLASRRAEIPGLAAAMLADVAASDDVHLTPGVIHALTAQDWPGNLRELKAVITFAAGRRTHGGIALTDLPERYRVASPAHTLTTRDRAERDAVVAALRAFDGNKVQAARELGMSRTTLYTRIRQLRITSY
ncbi:MAG: hypothetical protein L0G89_02940 [Janibacter sp.]|nr:hypothetical protein [Janibacter sp.]